MSTFTINNTVQNINFNGNDVQKLIFNGNLVWQKTQHDYSQDYLTFKITGAGSGTIVWNGYPGTFSKNIYYKLYRGNSSWGWYQISTNTNITVEQGDILQFYGDNNNYASNSSNYCYFSSDINFDVYGNIMSLINGTNFTSLNTIPASYCFPNLFKSCKTLINTNNLILPATTLANNCYFQMFNGCSNLINTPKLPATTLAKYCYQSMFQSCTSLTTAPELPALILTTSCYAGMFRLCSKLNYVKCLATDISTTGCLTNWLSSVGSSGTFVKDANTTFPAGASGIPSSWTIIDAT